MKSQRHIETQYFIQASTLLQIPSGWETGKSPLAAVTVSNPKGTRSFPSASLGHRLQMWRVEIPAPYGSCPKDPRLKGGSKADSSFTPPAF